MPLDDVLPHVVLLGEVEQFPDLGGSLGPEAARDGVVGESGDLLVPLLDDGHAEHSEVAVHDAATDRLPLTLASAAGAVAGVALGQKQLHATVGQDALLHWESLFVISSGDTEYVTFELVAERVGGDLGAHTLLAERADLVLVIDLDQLLAASGGKRQIYLHSGLLLFF